jgi:hypothetical protein
MSHKITTAVASNVENYATEMFGRVDDIARSIQEIGERR